jgi:hypothetical protein
MRTASIKAYENSAGFEAIDDCVSPEAGPNHRWRLARLMASSKVCGLPGCGKIHAPGAMSPPDVAVVLA